MQQPCAGVAGTVPVIVEIDMLTVVHHTCPSIMQGPNKELKAMRMVKQRSMVLDSFFAACKQ